MNTSMEATADVLGKYKLMLGMKSLDYEIKELTDYSKSCCDCYVLLKDRIDRLSSFMMDEENESAWRIYGDCEDVKTYAEKLRESSVQALCDMEKYHSSCICDKKQNIQGYLSTLSDAVRGELVRYGITGNSKVLFIGAGAFPLSSLTIAKDTGAAVLGLDIDAEAVQLARRVAGASGLNDKVGFTEKRVHELSFAQDATHVIIASLVKSKLALLDELRAVIQPEAKVILRYGNGLKSIFNYPLETHLEDDWITSKLPSHGTLYDSIILKKQPSQARVKSS
ncbi:nicotianamine synthase family protein [Paenibacillus thalictri]|nr:nicotianamine synthase family protein [Paenibacillus thalictri]